jgi:import inner membrane translocase subunit TIM9
MAGMGPGAGGGGGGVDNTADQIKQFKDFILNYNRLSEQCFTDCIFDFTGRTFPTKEDKCADNCVDKYLKMNQRIGQRFQEYQLVVNEKMSGQQLPK